MPQLINADHLVDAKKADYIALADRIWGTPELRFEEVQSCASQREQMTAAGFRVTAGIAGIDTAFVAEDGHSVDGDQGPIIAILGEFDALSGLSQEAGVAVKTPLVEGGNGHGCGHNLLGAGAMLAAVAARDFLVENNLPGRIRYYGCPAEEGGSGKTFMARAGAFDGIDAAVSWHPATVNLTMPSKSLANIQCYFDFQGRSAHAAGNPEFGRSALDALELMSVGVQYMREHMPDAARVHYSIIDGGGVSPNVIPDHTRALYLIRSPELSDVHGLFERVIDIARGAALMTGTTMSYEVDKACSSLLGNRVMDRLMTDQLKRIGGPAFDEADEEFAAEICKTFPREEVVAQYRMFGTTPPAGKNLDDRVFELPFGAGTIPGSTDVGDVSWQAPLSQCLTSCFAVGTPFHTWQLVAQGKSPAAHKGMVQAAKAMAGVATTLLSDRDLLKQAQAEFQGLIATTPYDCPLPADLELPSRRKARSAA